MIYKEEKKQQYTFRIQEFSSILDFTSHLEANSTKLNRHFSPRTQRSTHGGEYFSKTHSYEDALSLLIKGWTPQAEELTQKLKLQPTSGNIQSSRPTFSNVGFQASVPRYLQGIPTSMISRTPQIKQGKIIILNKDVVFHQGISADKITEEGVKALQLIRTLEGQGYRVKLNMIAVMKLGDEMATCRITVKKPEERLNLSKIAFPLAHPSMLRRMLFRWLEQFQEIQGNYSEGYGYATGNRYDMIMPEGEHLIPATIPDDYLETLLKTQNKK